MSSALIRVGALTVVVAVLAVVVGLYMGGVWSRLNTYPIYVRMPNAGGVEAGADVMLSGVRIGSVAAVELDPDEKYWPGYPVVFTLAIRRGAKIPVGYVFGVDQGGLLGTRYIAVEPPKKAAEKRKEQYLQRGACVKGVGLVGLAGIGALASEAKERLPALAESLQTRIEHLVDRAEATFLSEEHQRLIHTILVNFSQMTATANRAARNIERLSEALAGTAAAGRPDLLATLKEVKIAASNIRAAAEQVQRMVATSPLPSDLAAAGQHVRAAAESIDESAAAIRDFMTSPDTQLSLKELAGNIARASAALASLSESAEKFVADEQMQKDVKAAIHDLRQSMASLRQTADHLQAVFTDKQMTEDIRATVHDLRRIAARGVEVTDKANKSLDRVDRTMDRLSEAVQSVKPSYMYGMLDVHAARDYGLQADLDLNMYFGRKRRGFWRLGMVDIGDAERVDFQRGIHLGPALTMRAGVFANKVGLGLDWQRPGAGRAELELYNPDDVVADFMYHHPLGHRWSLTLGVRDFLDDANPMIGVRRAFDLTGSPQPEK